MRNINERVWTGHIIAWIKELIENKKTIFQEVTNDQGLKLQSGKTKYPDILLFIDKISGVVFNGWELKFPDVPVDNRELLLNALEKAEKLKASSFVTWNGAEAIIWKITNNQYNLNSITKLKTYPKEIKINKRSDLANWDNYKKFEPNLKNRLTEIIHDLEYYYRNNILAKAINISSNFISSIQDVLIIITPKITELIKELKGKDVNFRTEFNKWTILESSTLKILNQSSRRVEIIEEEKVLAKQIYFKLIAKVIFYLTLSDNLTARYPILSLKKKYNTQKELSDYFSIVKEIDYQAIFNQDFTDAIIFTNLINEILYDLILKFKKFDFKIFSTDLIGKILENLVPPEEKQKFGQYFTSQKLADLITFGAIKTCNDNVYDPTCGTGSFLLSAYRIFYYLGKNCHHELLSQIWGNDISHFPVTLAVINLYKLKVEDFLSFPRITRHDYFKIKPNHIIKFPDPSNIAIKNDIKMPCFDSIVSNFPFIQQEDIPKNDLVSFFKSEFNTTQEAFLKDKYFDIDKRSDYYTYCIYYSLKFLKKDGNIGVITSNAWLGKNYGIQLKKFILDNFNIKYIVRSNAEHWFKDSKVTTIFIILTKSNKYSATRFITINKKLDDFLKEEDYTNYFKKIENFYTQVNTCEKEYNHDFFKNSFFKDKYYKNDTTLEVSIVDRKILEDSIFTNWTKFFISSDPFEKFENFLIYTYPKIFIKAARGTRTDWDKMYLINDEIINDFKIEKDFCYPIIKSSTEIQKIMFDSPIKHYLFSCNKTIEELKSQFPGAYSWINKWWNKVNKKGELLREVNKKNKPFWYTMNPNKANIFISINPNERIFFGFSKKSINVNQRLTAILVDEDKVEFITALLNSIIILIYIELTGISRNLGVLDLNADFFKNKLKILNPDIVSEKDKIKILEKFRKISNRKIKNYQQELKDKDRIEFDKIILQSYNFDVKILDNLYNLLIHLIQDRIEMKTR